MRSALFDCNTLTITPQFLAFLFCPNAVTVTSSSNLLVSAAGAWAKELTESINEKIKKQQVLIIETGLFYWQR
jgi:hypothetical protein